MSAPNRYPDEVRRRAVDEVIERGRRPSDVARDLGMTATTISNWVRQVRRDRGLVPGPTSEQLAPSRSSRKRWRNCAAPTRS